MAGKWHEGVVSADNAALRDIDTSVAHPARVYDYWLGGKDNFAVDREAAEEVLAGQARHPAQRPGQPRVPGQVGPVSRG